MANVLAIGPHPDDVELSAGGTLALLAAAGHHLDLADLTAGERGTRGSLELRKREAEAARIVLGAQSRECLELPDGAVMARDPHHLAAVVALLRRLRPELVITLHGADDHPDHIEGAELVRRACYLSGLRNYPGPDSPVFRPARVLYAMGRRPFTPSLVVDVSSTYDIKRQALAAYGSQFRRSPDDPLVTPISDPNFLSTVEARDRTYGAMIQTLYGEPFFADGPVAARSASDLVPGVSA